MRAQYVRVSTLEQNTDRQSKIDNAKLYLDKISGLIPLFERPSGIKLKEDIDRGIIKELFVHSIDRLGRDILDILKTISYLTSKQVCLISEKEGIRTLIDGKENLASKLLVSILGTIADFEVQIRKESQQEGIAIAKINGVYKGRKRGTILNDSDVLTKHKNVVNELKRGESVRRTAKLCGVSTGTVQKVKKLINTASVEV